MLNVSLDLSGVISEGVVDSVVIILTHFFCSLLRAVLCLIWYFYVHDIVMDARYLVESFLLVSVANHVALFHVLHLSI